MQLTRLFQSQPLIPEIHRRNFRHLYFDIAWFGVLNGSFVAFSAVYLTRVGASAQQLGWFTAIPALLALLLSLPIGFWLKNKKLDRVVFWSAFIYRLYYIAWLPIIIFLPNVVQVNTILVLTVIMSMPGTVLAIGFNTLFAAVIPPDWRNHVIGIRHALLAISSILASLTCGYILETLPFLLGYGIVFGVAALAGAMSTLHLWFVDDKTRPDQPYNADQPLKEGARPGLFSVGGWNRPPSGFRYLAQQRRLRIPQFNILRGDFGRAMSLIVFLFFALYVANPLYYPYWVGELHYNDQLLSFGSALFYICQFLAASQLARLGRWIGTQKSLALGATLLSAYPGITALSIHPVAYLLASAFTGMAWGIAGGAILAYLLALVPKEERPNYMAWYSLLTNLAILAGSLTGPLISSWVGLRLGLATAALIRLLSGLLVWLFGQINHPSDTD